MGLDFALPLSDKRDTIGEGQSGGSRNRQMGSDDTMNEWFEAEQHIERAQMLSESQRWEEALEELEGALVINPNNPSWQAQRGFLLEELERWEEAADAYETALSLEPGEPEVTVALGNAWTHLGRFGQALELFEELGRQNPDYEPAYCHRIAVYAELGRHDQAEEMFYIAQELDDACPQCFYHMGGSLAARGEFDRAIFCWKRTLEFDPDAAGVNRRIAQAYRSQGKREAAKEYYIRELRDDPGNTDLLYEMAEMALEAGDLAAAAKFNQIIELEPEYAEAHFALGRIALLRNQPQEALKTFEMVQSLCGERTDIPGFEHYLGEALFRLGRFAAAHKQVEIAIEKAPQQVGSRLLLGGCLLALHKPESAADAFRHALSLDGGNALAHQQLAVCLMRVGRFKRGVEQCLKALEHKPDFVPAMSTAGIGYLRLARWREARAMFTRALEKDAHNAELGRLAGRIWQYRLRHYLGKLASLAKWAIGRGSA